MAKPVDNVRLPEHIESGARIGPSFSTSVVTFSSGGEESNSNWNDELLVIDAGYGVMDQSDPDDQENSYLAILDFFRARKGKHRGFLFRDLTDYQVIGGGLRKIAGTDHDYQLGKFYDNYFRKITRPVLETLIIYNDGELLDPSNYQVRPFGVIRYVGEIVSDEPDEDGEPPKPRVVEPTADFDFFIPVRFDQDEMSASITHIRAGELPDVKIIQIRE